MTTTMPTNAQAVSRALRKAGLHPISPESMREGIQVAAGSRGAGDAYVRILLILDGQARRMRAAAIEALTDAGYELDLSNSSDTEGFRVVGKIAP
jgi:hypothetical protein